MFGFGETGFFEKGSNSKKRLSLGDMKILVELGRMPIDGILNYSNDANDGVTQMAELMRFACEHANEPNKDRVDDWKSLLIHFCHMGDSEAQTCAEESIRARISLNDVLAKHIIEPEDLIYTRNGKKYTIDDLREYVRGREKEVAIDILKGVKSTHMKGDTEVKSLSAPATIIKTTKLGHKIDIICPKKGLLYARSKRKIHH